MDPGCWDVQVPVAENRHLRDEGLVPERSRGTGCDRVREVNTVDNPGTPGDSKVEGDPQKLEISGNPSL